MTLNAKLLLLVVALAVAADLAGAAAEATAAFAVLHAVPRPAALRSIRPVHLLFRRGARPTLRCLCVGLALENERSCSRLALY